MPPGPNGHETAPINYTVLDTEKRFTARPGPGGTVSRKTGGMVRGPR